MIVLTPRHTQPHNMAACTHIKENILCVMEKKTKEVRDEWHPDTDSYLKEHFG